MVTGWADAVDRDGSSLLDVPLLVAHGTRLAVRDGVRLVRDSRLPAPVDRYGVPCASPERAVYDAMRLAADDRAAVVVMDMATAAVITSMARVAAFSATQVRRPGAGQVCRGLALASESSRSPRETLMRLTWVLDAGLPSPLVNRAVHDRAGRFVGVADLLDVEAGVAGEYDGALHRDRARHRRDVARHQRFRGVGIETFTVVAGDNTATQVERMHSARRRALWLPEYERGWVLGEPDARELSLDDDQAEFEALHHDRVDLGPDSWE